MEHNKYEESLLLLLELADKYLDINKKTTIKKENIENVIELEKKPEEEKVTRKDMIDSLKGHERKIEDIVAGEDTEYMFSVLVGEHFINEEELKKEIEEIKENQKKIELTKEEEEKMKKTKEIIHNNLKEISKEQQGEDIEALLEIMDIYMDIYKP